MDRIFKLTLVNESSEVQGEYQIVVTDSNDPEATELEEGITVHRNDLSKEKVVSMYSKDLGEQIMADVKAIYFQEEAENAIDQIESGETAGEPD